jgi:hypothetical protein
MFSSSSPRRPSTVSYRSRCWRWTKQYWDSNEFGGALLVYLVVIVAAVLAHTILFPSLDLDRIEPLTSSQAAATVAQATQTNTTLSADAMAGTRVPRMVGSLTLRTVLHILYVFLPVAVILNIVLCRSVSPGYVQDLVQIAERERRLKIRREKVRAAKQAKLAQERQERDRSSPSAARNEHAEVMKARSKEESKEETDTGTETEDERTLLPMQTIAPPPPPASPPAIAAPPSTSHPLQPSAIHVARPSTNGSANGSATSPVSDAQPSGSQARLITFYHDADEVDEKDELDFAALDLTYLSSNDNTPNPLARHAKQVKVKSDEVQLALSTTRAKKSAPGNGNGNGVANQQPEMRMSSPTFCARVSSNTSHSVIEWEMVCNRCLIVVSSPVLLVCSVIAIVLPALVTVRSVPRVSSRTIITVASSVRASVSIIIDSSFGSFSGHQSQFSDSSDSPYSGYFRFHSGPRRRTASGRSTSLSWASLAIPSSPVCHSSVSWFIAG